MATVQDFINTYMGLETLMLQRQQQKTAEQNAAVNRMAVMQGLQQQMMGGGAIADLAGFAAGQGGLEGDMMNILGQTAPGQGTVQRTMESEGLSAMDPMQRGQVAEQAATRAGTGQGTFGMQSEQLLQSLLDPNRISNAMRDEFTSRLVTGQGGGQMALSHALSRLPEGELQEGAGAGIGTRLGATGHLQGEIAAAGSRLGWASLEQAGALGEADLQLRAAANEFNQRLGLMSIQAEQNGDFDSSSTLAEVGSLLRNMEQDKATMSEFTADMYLRTLQNHFDGLRKNGYAAPDWSSVTVDDVLSNEPLNAVKRWWADQQRKMNR